MRPSVLAFCFSCLPLFLTASALAQTGTVTGQVFDPAGAVVPNAQVLATSTATGLSRTVSTSSAGLYNLANLPPSTYNVVVTAPGFQPATRNGVVLTIAAVLPLNITLSLAGADSTIDVADANESAVETDSFQLSTVIDSRQINDLPLILRDPYQLVLLSPGAVTSTNNNKGFSVNGERDRNNNFLLDGVDNNDTSVPGGQGGISSANPDSTQEFRVITSNFDAEFGRNTGAVIDVITRGGGNQFHGDAYEFGRYNALGARDFFNTKANGKQDPYVRNDFGASVGGPLWKDHTFFFLNGEAQRFRTTRTASQTVPTAAYRTGNYTFIDPFDGSRTAVNLTNGLANPNNQTGFGVDPNVAKILAVTPLGQADNGDGVSASYFFPSSDALNAYNFTGRLDQKLTDRHQLTVRYIYGHSNESDPFNDEVLPGYGNSSNIFTTHNGAITLASSLSPTITNLFRGGYNQNNSGFFCNHAAIDAVTGVDAYGNGRDIALPGFFTLGCVGLFDSNGQARLSSTLSFGDTISITKGTHSVKFGGDFRSVKDANYDDFSARELLSLNDSFNYGATAYTFNGSPNSPNGTAFQDYAFGLQGLVAEDQQNQFFDRLGNRVPHDLTRFRQHEFDVYAQDNWKISKQFTAILGVRYTFNGVPYELNGNFSNLYQNASTLTPANGFIFTPVGPGTGRQVYSDSWNLIEPRVGFAYDIAGDGKTAIRGGYGIFHDRIFDNLFGNAKSNPPFQNQANLFPFDGSPTTPTVSNNAFPATAVPSAAIFDGALISPVVIDPNLKIPTTQSFNIGIQRELRAGLTMEVNYVGSRSTHVLRELDGAPPQPALVAAEIASGVLPSALQRTALYTGGTDANGTDFNPAVNNTAFFHTYFQTATAISNYNALQAKVSGQIGGLSFIGSYSYAHSLDNGTDALSPGAGNSGFPRNSFDLAPEYGSSDFDVRHRGTIAASYNLPIGHAQRFLNHGVLGVVFDGIEISGIQQVQTGLPFDLRGTVDNLHTSVNNRPELIGAPYPSGRGTSTAQGVIVGPSATAFANAPFDQNVSIHRNKFTGPGFVNTDVVFQKTQTLYEQVKVIFRAESYNVLNHPNFSSPDTLNHTSLTLGSPTFGLATSQVGQNDSTTGARQIQGAVKLVF